MKRSLKFLLLTAAAVLPATTAAAQHTDALDEVVVTAAPYAVSTDSAMTAVDVVNREAIDLAPPAGLGEVLSGLPGLRSTFFGPGASRPVIRGLAGPRVLVLTNGVGQVDASALSPDHQVASDPAEAERIEVLRGPAALAYGGSAIGGVVNVIDGRIARTRPSGAVDGRLAASVSTVDQGANVSGGLKAGAGPIVFTVDGVRRSSEDYKIPVPPESALQLAADGEDPPTKADSKVPNSAVELKAYGGGVSYVGENGYLGLAVKRTETAYGVPGHSHDGEDPVTIDLAQTRVDVQGEWRQPVGTFARTKLSAGYADYRHAELEGSAVGTVFASEGVEGRLELVQRERNGWSGAVGLQGLKRELTATGAEAYVPSVDIDEIGAFTIQRLDKDSWGLEGGVRLDRRRLRIATDERGFTNVSATAGAFVRPRAGWFLGLSASRTARAPTEAELFADGPHVATRGFEVGDRSLRSEVAWSLDAAAHFEGDRLDADLHLFAADYDRFIDLRPTGAVEDGLAVFAYSQTDARFHGFEAEAEYDLWRDGERSLRLEGAADYVRATSDNGRLPRIPPWSLTGRLVYEAGFANVRLEVRRVAAQERVAAFELPTEGYTMVNASAHFHPLKDERFTVFVDARNLTDAEAREHASFLKDLAPLPGRSFRIGLSAAF